MSLRLPAYKSKAREAIKLALPIIGGQLGQILMGFFDTVQIGGLGHEYIAGSGFANNLFWMTTLLGMGVLFSVSTLVSEAWGEKHPWKAIGIYRSGIKVALILAAVFSIAILGVIQSIHLFGQDEIVNRIAIRFLRIMIFSVVFIFLFAASKQLLDGMGRTTIGMYITIGGLAVNVFLNWVLIYGNLGFPRMEIEGSAIATTVSRILMTSAFLIIIWRDKKIRELRRQFSASLEKQKSYVRPILRIGIPAGLQFFWEVAAFGAGQIMSGWLGIVQEAAHQIAIGLASITFMVLTGISAAGNILTGFSYGAKDREGMRISGYTILALTLCLELVFAIFFFSLNQYLPMLYTDNAVLAFLFAFYFRFVLLFRQVLYLRFLAVQILLFVFNPVLFIKTLSKMQEMLYLFDIHDLSFFITPSAHDPIYAMHDSYSLFKKEFILFSVGLLILIAFTELRVVLAFVKRIREME